MLTDQILHTIESMVIGIESLTASVSCVEFIWIRPKMGYIDQIHNASKRSD